MIARYAYGTWRARRVSRSSRRTARSSKSRSTTSLSTLPNATSPAPEPTRWPKSLYDVTRHPSPPFQFLPDNRRHKRETEDRGQTQLSSCPSVPRRSTENLDAKVASRRSGTVFQSGQVWFRSLPALPKSRSLKMNSKCFPSLPLPQKGLNSEVVRMH